MEHRYCGPVESAEALNVRSVARAELDAIRLYRKTYGDHPGGYNVRWSSGVPIVTPSPMSIEAARAKLAKLI